MLNDSNLFEGNAELTTKEILKRWGKIGKLTQASTSPGPSRSNAGHQAQGRTGTFTHVAQDTHAWQNESSVRHVGASNMTYGQSGNTPPAAFSNANNDPAGSPHRQSQFRSNAFPNQGALGITGTG
jgi:hypothetical protein